MKLIFTLSLFFAVLACYAQENVYFLKNNGKYVDKVDSADYIRIVKPPDSGSTLFNVTEYYKAGKVKSIGKSAKINPPRYIGQYISFYPSGKRESNYRYQDGAPVGNAYDYYPNGKIYRIIKYPDSLVRGDNHFVNNYLITANLDSTGNAQVTDGQGYYKGFNSKFAYVDEEGPVKDGKRDGTWKGLDKNLKLTFTETYQDNQLLSGTATDSTGTITTYTGSRMTSPKFNGGDVAFGRYLGSHIIYPDDARKNDIEGIVVLQFVIEKDGKITNVQVQKSVSKSLDVEAERVIRNSPKWIPGTRFGKPVRVTYAVPINFALR